MLLSGPVPSHTVFLPTGPQIGDARVMALDIATVRQIAFLARIKVPDAELAGLASELSTIIGWVEQLNEVRTDGVKPIYSVSDMTLFKRADEVTDGNCRDKVLANAPEAEAGCYAVPKVVE